jgi:inosine/xanthosine triphosphatase
VFPSKDVLGDDHKQDDTWHRWRPVHIAVGSSNPVKRRAVESTLGDCVEAVDLETVDSGVPDQPRGHAETHTGALNRAEAAVSAEPYDLGLGLEGGVSTFGFTDGTFLIMWAAATDGTRTEVAAGPQFRLPEAVAQAVGEGRELGPALDEHLGRSGTKFQEGAAGVVTNGLTDRSTALGQAVAGVVGPFLSA